jgi:hypothetical protein
VASKLHYSFNYLFSPALNNVGNPSSAQWHDAYKQPEHLVNLSLDYNVFGASDIYLRIHNLIEEHRPVTTFNTGMPNQAYLGSDERRIYLGFRARF